MPDAHPLPKSLESLKRRAKSRRKSEKIPHMTALASTAVDAGFSNYESARTSLSNSVVPNGFRTFVSAYWYDKQARVGGRETIEFSLTKPLNAVIEQRHLNLHQAFYNFRFDGPDHISSYLGHNSQDRARDRVCTAARVLQFAAATGLTPSRSIRSALPKTSYREPLPGCDHYSSWYCRKTGRYLFVDEPYQLNDKLIAERTDWAKKFDFEIAAPDWLGTHNPYAGTRLFVLSHKTLGLPLPQVLRALAQLDRPIDDRNWQGLSGPVVPPFYSPGWELEHKLKSNKVTKKAKPLGPRKTIEFFMFGVGKCRRPDARMPISSHTEVGTGLKHLLVRYAKRPGVYNRLDHVRSELDEWVQREYARSELGDEQFFDLYYHETASADSAAARNIQSDIESILRIKKTIESHYPSCPPVRKLLAKLGLAVESLEKMRSLVAQE